MTATDSAILGGPGWAARVLASAGEVVAQSDQSGAQLLTLVVVEPGEQRVFGLALSARCALEVLLAGRSERDDVAAAIYRVALARDEVVGFEQVE